MQLGTPIFVIFQGWYLPQEVNFGKQDYYIFYGAEKLFDELVQADEEIESSRAFDKFKYGFHLGVLMMMEIMESYEDMLA